MNEQLPLDLEVRGSPRGRPVKLGDYFDGELPVILTLNYSSCPMLCSLQLDGLFDGLKRMNSGTWASSIGWSPSVSIRPSRPSVRP